MSLWRVYELYGCSGNPVDGYEDCQQRSLGFVSIRDDWKEGQIIEALAREGHLTKQAVDQYMASEISFESDHGDGYELGDLEQAWAYVGGDNPEYTDHDPALNAQEVAAAEEVDYVEGMHERIDGFRPFMRIEPEYPDDEARPFWRAKTGAPTDHGLAVVELRINPEKMTRKKRTGDSVLTVQVYVDGEFFGARDFPDAFEDDEAIGLAENGMVTNASSDDASEQGVALDAFLGRGGLADARFLKVLTKEDAKALFADDPELPKLVERDGVTNGSEHWPDSIDISAGDIRSIREDFRTWATRQVDLEDDALDDYVADIYQGSRPAGAGQYTKPQLEVLKQWYRSGVISGLAMWARQYAERHGEEVLEEDADAEIETIASGLAHGRNPSADDIRDLPTLATAQTADLKFDDGRTRVWLERVGVADGARWDDGVLIEELIDGRWETVTEYAG
jgi:hypothetical protein